MSGRITVGIVLLLSLSFVALGQEIAAGGITRTETGIVNGRAVFGAAPFTPRAVVGSPYSAERHQEQVQTLADGTHITHTQSVVKIWRDSQGRTREERPLLYTARIENLPYVAIITDNVAAVRYILDMEKKVAHRTKLAPRPVPNTSASVAAGRLGTVRAGAFSAVIPPFPPAPGGTSPSTIQPQITSEDLGTQVIEGVLAKGRRTTQTLPVGAIGNDRPLVSTSEVWTSPDLNTIVLLKSSDPRSGESTMQLLNISRAEPDPTLFTPPPDYTVEDDTGDVTITFGSTPVH